MGFSRRRAVSAAPRPETNLYYFGSGRISSSSSSSWYARISRSILAIARLSDASTATNSTRSWSGNMTFTSLSSRFCRRSMTARLIVKANILMSWKAIRPRTKYAKPVISVGLRNDPPDRALGEAQRFGDLGVGLPFELHVQHLVRRGVGLG